jgi:beta-N-acetylhexosaminidase
MAKQTAAEPPAAGLISPGGAELGLVAARRAIAVEGTAPAVGDALVVQFESASTIAEGSAPWGLAAHVRLGAGPAAPMRLVAAHTSADELRAAAGGRPIVVAGRNLHRIAGAATLIESLSSTETVVVVEMGWPSSWRPALARAFVTTHGASRANGRAAAEALGLA